MEKNFPPMFYGVLNFLGHPLMWKNFGYVYQCICDKRFPKGPTSYRRTFWKSNFIDWCHIIHFLAHFYGIFRTPCMGMCTCLCIWNRGTKKTPPHKEIFFGRATILMEVIYLIFQPFSWDFLIFRTPCMPKIHFE